MLRIHTKLDERTEACIAEVVDAGFTVHSVVGPGYGEAIYRNAMRVELTERRIPFVSEQSFSVTYRGQVVGVHRVDFVVQDCVLIEMKALRAYEPAHMAQILSYLKASQLRAGLLMNFACATFKEGLKRIGL